MIKTLVLFVVNIYQQTSTKFVIDFQRRSGCCHSFHKIKNQIEAIIFNKPNKWLSIDFHAKIIDQDSGKNINQITINKEILNNLNISFTNGGFELCRELISTLAVASNYNDNCKIIRDNEQIKNTIYRLATIKDVECVRYALVVVTNLYKIIPPSPQLTIDDIIKIANDSNLNEIKYQCSNVLNAIKDCPLTKINIRNKAKNFANQLIM